MVALNPKPTNTSLLQPTKFQFIFARMPNLTYFCQNVSLPGAGLSEIIRNTPFVDLYVPGEKLVYEPIDITFLVDEDLRTWLEIYDWMVGLTFPEDFNQYRRMLKEKSDFGGTVSDATLTILTNKNQTNIRVKFKDCFPTSLGALPFDSTSDANQVMTSTLSLRYNYFTVDII